MSNKIKVNKTYYNLYNNAYVEVTEVRDGIVYFWDERLEQDDGINIAEFHKCFTEKEATMKYSIGDRVEVVNIDKSSGHYYQIGDIGAIEAFNGGGYNVKLDSGTNRKLNAPFIWESELKLITKGNDMEIEVGQVWEGHSDFCEGRKTTIEKIDINCGGSVYIHHAPHDKSIQFKDSDECFKRHWQGKLITNIKGDNKMEKKIKINGIELKPKMGVKANGHKGNIRLVSPEHTLFIDTDGVEHSAKTSELEILYNIPIEAIIPTPKIINKAQARKLIKEANKVLKGK